MEECPVGTVDLLPVEVEAIRLNRVDLPSGVFYSIADCAAATIQTETPRALRKKVLVTILCGQNGRFPSLSANRVHTATEVKPTLHNNTIRLLALCRRQLGRQKGLTVDHTRHPSHQTAGQNLTYEYHPSLVAAPYIDS